MTYDKITSTQNVHIKQTVGLRERKARQETGLTIVEGAREVSRAWDAKADFKEVYICRDFFQDHSIEKLVKKIASSGITVIEATDKVFNKISFGDRKEGILAVCQPKFLKLSEWNPPSNPLLVVIENVEKPGNLGAIVRTCDAAGVDGVLVCEDTVDLYNPNVIRASIGTVFGLDLIQVRNKEALQFLRYNNVKICGTFPNASELYTEADFTGPVALVMGAEQTGLSDFWAKQADVKVKIPMNGQGDSLNVSVTTAVMIYEALRQRNQ